MQRMTELYELINKYQKAYYYDNESLISDEEFDELINELKQLEQKYPEYIIENTPTQKVGGFVDVRFQKENHDHRMLSLDNVFSFEEFIEFDNKIKEEINKDVEYVCELKIDGLAMSLKYDDTLKKAVTRGDGLIGENVTHNVKTIKTLPKSVKISDFEVRGEVFISKQEFENINRREEKEYANPRNLAAGTIRQLNQDVAKKRELDMYVYGLVEPEKYEIDTYYESMMYLKKLGFKTNEYIKLCSSAKEVINYIEEITELRDELAYEIDGVVIKVNDFSLQKKLGTTAKYPKWATAYKFKSNSSETIIEDIFLTVGRTGKITPNAQLLPVHLMGSTISRATLHNLNYIEEKDIRVGDYVNIIKAGDIIPRVESVNLDKREYQKKYIMPVDCPVCHNELKLIDSEHFCINEKCGGRQLENLSHFISRDGMNIDGLGPKNIEKLIENNLISSYVDLYELKYEDLIILENFQEKSVNNILTSIQNSKNRPLENFIYSLGIKNVGLSVAKLICQTVDNIEKIFELTIEDLIAIDGIGEVIAINFVTYFLDDDNKSKIKKFVEQGYSPLLTQKTISNKLTGEIIVITGSFEGYSRKELKEVFELNGAKVTGSISKQTTILVAGEKAGSKLKKAQDLGLRIIEEQNLSKFIEETNE